MKRRTAIAIVLGLVMILAIILLANRRPKIALEFVEYQRWPHGAHLRLTNGTQRVLRYTVQPNDTPGGQPLLCLEKTSYGWTNTSLTTRSVTVIDGMTGKKKETLIWVNANAGSNGPVNLDILSSRELLPGRSVDFFIRLELGAMPRRVGTTCFIPQSAMAQSRLMVKVQPWWMRIKSKLGLNKPPGRVDVWCPEELSMPALMPAQQNH